MSRAPLSKSTQEISLVHLSSDLQPASCQALGIQQEILGDIPHKVPSCDSSGTGYPDLPTSVTQVAKKEQKGSPRQICARLSPCRALLLPASSLSGPEKPQKLTRPKQPQQLETPISLSPRQLCAAGPAQVAVFCWWRGRLSAFLHPIGRQRLLVSANRHKQRTSQ